MGALVQFPKCHLGQTHASFDGDIDFKQWRAIGDYLCRVSGASQWWIGDWLIAGAQQFVGSEDGPVSAEVKQKRKEAHERYTKAVEMTGYDASSLKHMVCVARAFTSCRRRHDISWSHHAEVLALPDAHTQDQFLEKAAKGDGKTKWTRSQLRQAIRNHLADKNGTGNEGGPQLDFAPSRWARQFTRWIHVQVDPKAGGEPIIEWPKARKDALRRELRPIVDVYEELGPDPTPRKESLPAVSRNR